ncbi:unnamed protein product [Arabidopsis arenosa]|uniref:DUF4283 domain-containing protein n=1 Tax=Arabidopsis arenosa TaxID=38785 RepID=A0A8S2AZ10_ARAAE|nr:unnamed protein product [Arabidopsis arenosa]
MKIVDPKKLLPPDPPGEVVEIALGLDSSSSSAIPQISSSQAPATQISSSPAPVTQISPPLGPVAQISSSTATAVQDPSSIAIVSQIHDSKSSLPEAIPSTAAPSYAQRFKASLRNLRKIHSPVVLEDGAPVVQAPASVLLRTADQWKGHIVAKFHGLIPPSSKIYSDLNPAWGKFGNIVVRAVSDTSCLILIPCLSTREWVLQVGYWQAGNCAFNVYPWSADGSLEMHDLETAPTWAVLENVPPQMYSLDGISVIASAIGEPLHTEKSRLDPYYFGNTKVKVEISLDVAPPTVIIVKDNQLNSVKVKVSYPRLPPKCCNCLRFGHLLNRCPKPLMKRQRGSDAVKGLTPKGTAVANTNTCLADKGGSLKTVEIGDSSGENRSQLSASSKRSNKRTKARAAARRKSKERSRSNPHVDRVVAHKRDELMSVNTQELVKKWIKESQERKVSDSQNGSGESKIEVLNDSVQEWTVVGVKSKGKGKAKEKKGNSHNKNSFGDLNKGIPGMKSSKKLAKLEAKMMFVKKPAREPYKKKSASISPIDSPVVSSGLNGHSRQSFLRSWIVKNRPSLGCILETHVSEENASQVLRSTFPGWRGEMNYQLAENGRIWVIWDPAISVICFHKSAQCMLCGVFVPATGESFSVAFVYAFNTVVERRDLWRELTNIVQNSPANQRPLVVMGDFNQILTASEHYSVLPHHLPLAGMSELQTFLGDNELDDLPSRGVFFTWSNGRQEDPIIRKLDRVVVNESWRDSFPESLAVFDPPGDSDHAPALVSLSSTIERSKKAFKYFSFLSTHHRYKEVIRTAWHQEVSVGCKLFTFGQKMKKVKAACRELNREGFGNIQQKTKEALAQLELVQEELLSNPSDSLFREEFVARKKWNFFAKAQETFYMQKSRIRWTKDGDACTAFFFKSVIANQGRNSIKYLRGDDGERIENSDQIKNMLLSYYKNLLGTENSGVTPPSVEDIKNLLPFRCDSSLASQLLKVPSMEEIRDTVSTMPRRKAPGPDGFPVEFLWESWEQVGKETVEAVQEFFMNGYLPRIFNATAITLIPKVQGADTLTQFRPVSCCTTVYKIIARLLKNKLKLFISDAVQGSQVGFVQGRHLCENVLLASELVSDFHAS